MVQQQIQVVELKLPTASQRKKDSVSSEATQVMEMQMEHLFIQDFDQLWLLEKNQVLVVIVGG
jgi:hypothetical protein